MSRRRRSLQRNGKYPSRRCFYCNGLLDPNRKGLPGSPSTDHYIALAKGGTNKLDNLVVACKSCNERKGDMMPDEFMQLLKDEKWPRWRVKLSMNIATVFKKKSKRGGKAGKIEGCELEEKICRTFCKNGVWKWYFVGAVFPCCKQTTLSVVGEGGFCYGVKTMSNDIPVSKPELSPHYHLHRAIQLIGVQKDLARLLNCSQQKISYHLNGHSKGIPMAWCKPIEEATHGEVTAKQLRPDIFIDH